ncbi:hypothetical protein QQ008_14110 [Fulvivirgaceae bacterium BMA10]|uniref:DUF4178 domain-containing protein n=1 Tax=Splendidivirga corallicola TaxID=3051826 RepID=A0ABT8KR86_9BACT|nr:hypothetical protein [Fulvivirgaceae bacterium BMA10]
MPVTVNDQYWLNRSKSVLDGSLDKIDKASEKLEALIRWAFPIFTASSIFSIEYNEISVGWTFLLASPYLLLLLSYWLILQVKAPVPTSYDPRIPHIIKKSYQDASGVKGRRLKRATISTLATIVVLSLALYSSFVIKRLDVKESLKVSYWYESPVEAQVATLVTLKSGIDFETRVYSECDTMSKYSIGTSSGQTLEFKINTSKCKKYKVELIWKGEGDIEKKIAKEITIKSLQSGK